MRYFEDYPVGARFPLGVYTITAEGIIDFAGRFDPQDIHLGKIDPVGSEFGGLIASGWHISSIFMNLFVTGVINDSSAEVSPGVDELRWLRPVRDGDELTGQLTVRSTSPSLRKGSAIVTFEGGLTVRDEPVMKLAMHCLFRKRDA